MKKPEKFSGEVKGNHPLAEIIAKKLFGIGGVPYDYAERMVSNACKEAVAYHDAEMGRIREGLPSEDDIYRESMGCKSLRHIAKAIHALIMKGVGE